MGTEEQAELERRELVQAHEYLGYWQRELRLDHFDFEIKVMHPKEKCGVMADCTEAPMYSIQKIRILNPTDRTDKDRAVFRRDLEVSIVYELLHTKEATWRDHPKVKAVLDEDEWLKQLHEDSIDATAQALVRARRGMRR